jgi:hypothetical protein
MVVKNHLHLSSDVQEVLSSTVTSNCIGTVTPKKYGSGLQVTCYIPTLNCKKLCYLT